jgi:hypothetical protein
LGRGLGELFEAREAALKEPHALVIAGRPEWRAWIAQARAALGLPTSAALVEVALQALAEREGIEPPPERVKPVGWNQYAEPEGGN